ncbi:DUF2871 domain-containing protein [Aerococcaceae bacterium NML180378]|nr:DUF2871 domain-containing protein [Aerococcaceae bacterium NML180378]
MQKLVKWSAFYTVLGLLSGLFYRTVVLVTGYTDETQLNTLHTHLLVLGTFFFLIVLLLDAQFRLSQHPKFNMFMLIYNGGVLLTTVMMLVRGLVTVYQLSDSHAIAGIAGIGHIVLTIAFGLFFVILFDSVKHFK